MPPAASRTRRANSSTIINNEIMPRYRLQEPGTPQPPGNPTPVPPSPEIPPPVEEPPQPVPPPPIDPEIPPVKGAGDQLRSMA
jgi:hypothetical protein